MRKNFKAAPRKPLPKIWVEPIDWQCPRDPHTKRRLPAKGGLVPDNTFWNRRIRHKEVKKAKAPTAPRKPRAQPQPAPKTTISEE